MNLGPHAGSLHSESFFQLLKHDSLGTAGDEMGMSPSLRITPCGRRPPPPQLGPDEEHHDLCTWLLAPWTVPLAVGAADA